MGILQFQEKNGKLFSSKSLSLCSYEQWDSFSSTFLLKRGFNSSGECIIVFHCIFNCISLLLFYCSSNKLQHNQSDMVLPGLSEIVSSIPFPSEYPWDNLFFCLWQSLEAMQIPDSWPPSFPSKVSNFTTLTILPSVVTSLTHPFTMAIFKFCVSFQVYLPSA